MCILCLGELGGTQSCMASVGLHGAKVVDTVCMSENQQNV